MMFFLVLFCFGAVFGDGNVTAPAVGQNVTGPAPIVTTAAPQIDLVSLFTQFITEARVNDARHSKEIKRIHNLVTEKFSGMTERFATINSAVSKNAGSITTIKGKVSTNEGSIAALKRDQQVCITGHKYDNGQSAWTSTHHWIPYGRTFKEKPNVVVIPAGSYKSTDWEAPAFFLKAYNVGTTQFKLGIWMDAKQERWDLFSYWMACGKV